MKHRRANAALRISHHHADRVSRKRDALLSYFLESCPSDGFDWTGHVCIVEEVDGGEPHLLPIPIAALREMAAAPNPERSPFPSIFGRIADSIERHPAPAPDALPVAVLVRVNGVIRMAGDIHWAVPKGAHGVDADGTEDDKARITNLAGSYATAMDEACARASSAGHERDDLAILLELAPDGRGALRVSTKAATAEMYSSEKYRGDTVLPMEVADLMADACREVPCTVVIIFCHEGGGHMVHGVRFLRDLIELQVPQRVPEMVVMGLAVSSASTSPGTGGEGRPNAWLH